jgi:hypothetical protein
LLAMLGIAPGGFVRGDVHVCSLAERHRAGHRLSACRSASGSRPSGTATHNSLAFARAREGDNAVRPFAGPSPISRHPAAARVAEQPELGVPRTHQKIEAGAAGYTLSMPGGKMCAVSVIAAC